MSRKRKSPPGSKKRGPTAAGAFDPFGMKPSEVRYRMENMQAVVAVAGGDDEFHRVMWEAHRFLNEGVWEPALPENWTLMGTEPDEGGGALLCAYGLPDFTLGTLAWHLEQYAQEHGLDLWDVLDHDAVQG